MPVVAVVKLDVAVLLSISPDNVPKLTTVPELAKSPDAVLPEATFNVAPESTIKSFDVTSVLNVTVPDAISTSSAPVTAPDIVVLPGVAFEFEITKS